MAGYVLYNGFWNPKTIPDPVRRLVAAGDRLGFALQARPNTSFAAEISRHGGSGLTAADTVLCWDKDVRLLRMLEADGVAVYNSAEAVAVCDDKSLTHVALTRAGLPTPRTLLAPMTYLDFSAEGETFLRTAAETLGFPLVFKECFGSLGEQVYLIRNREELLSTAARMHHRPFILQEFLAEAAGEDKRLYVVDGRVVAAMRRRSADDFRANIGAGGTGEAYIPTAAETALAQQACQALGLLFAGVDILGSNRGPLLCEVNASAHMAALEACTGVDVAGHIVSAVIKRRGI